MSGRVSRHVFTKPPKPTSVGYEVDLRRDAGKRKTGKFYITYTTWQKTEEGIAFAAQLRGDKEKWLTKQYQ
jgi:hypothetical protein